MPFNLDTNSTLQHTTLLKTTKQNQTKQTKNIQAVKHFLHLKMRSNYWILISKFLHPKSTIFNSGRLVYCSCAFHDSGSFSESLPLLTNSSHGNSLFFSLCLVNEGGIKQVSNYCPDPGEPENGKRIGSDFRLVSDLLLKRGNKCTATSFRINLSLAKCLDLLFTAIFTICM